VYKSLLKKQAYLVAQFESTGEISLRQFLMLYAEIGKLTELQKLTQKTETPKSLDKVIKHA